MSNRIASSYSSRVQISSRVNKIYSMRVVLEYRDSRVVVVYGSSVFTVVLARCYLRYKTKRITIPVV